MLIAGFLDWYSVDAGSVSVGFTGFDFFLTGVVPWILLVGVGVVTFLLAARMMRAGTTPWALIMLAAAALALLLVIIRVIAGPGHGAPDNHGMDRSIGLWLALIGGAVSTFGAFQGFTESGGRLDDLKNPDRLKAQFDRGGRDRRDDRDRYDDRDRRDRYDDRDRDRDRGYDGRGRGTPPPPPPGYDDRR